jgi:hypothetical protein
MLPNRPRMREHTATSRHAVAIFAACVVLDACTKDQPEPKVVANAPPVAPMTKPADSTTTVLRARWNDSDGSAIYLPGDAGAAQVILPPVLDDSVPKPGAAVLPAGAAPASVDLFAPSGGVGRVQLGGFASATQPEAVEGCDAWPIVPIRDASGAAVPGWRIALQAGVATPTATDSIGALSRADSAELVVQINRAAAQLALDSAGVLRRVPFGVTKAYRLRFPGDVDAIIAVVERRLNVEASPRVERTVLVLERPPKVKSYSAVWRDTQYATEDDLIAVDLLAVVTLRGEQRPAVFLGLDFGDGSRVQMLQRSPGGIWSLRWASAYTGC